ncbi:hypothetical protein NRIC_20770 [Enterococcus florum]|uniref:Uncharacterized protein n=1 Tax=Enterococcus florum TaxID=2480627 RepID=A0A4P5P9E5_9ENTE|nr:hypothetical protein [Enterococcus florum]GCF94186.1 hypothetical protein NRIC_20770 [Enterococcus florum]
MRKILVTVLSLTVVFGAICSVAGLFAFNTDYAFHFVNQYGETIKMWGYGLYKHDSYFKAPIFIGTDCMMLFGPFQALHSPC